LPKKQPIRLLKDVPSAPLRVLKALAAEEAAIKKDAPPAGRRRPKRKTDMGALEVGKYLADHGIAYRVKQDAQGTLYVLDQCLFDPSHGRGEAAIVQNPGNPLRYQCFHNSCGDRTWAQARTKISGGKSLAPWMSGYDPSKAPGVRKSPGLGSGDGNVQATTEGKTPADWKARFGDRVPPPEEINPGIFYELRNGRKTFIPLRMAQYLLALREGHVVYSGGDFWVYGRGVWVTCSPEVLGQQVVLALGDETRVHSINGSIEILKHLTAKNEMEWPSHENHVNCLDGMVNLTTGEIESHSPDFWSRSQIPCHFNPDAYAAVDPWLKFLDQIWPGEAEKGKIDVLQEFFGYCLAPHCRYQKALFLYGPGANGKSVLLNVIEDLVGRENVSALSIHDLSERFNRSMLLRRLINISYETNSRSPAAMETFKAAVAGDLIKAEEKYSLAFKFKPYAKFIIAMNEPPVFGQSSSFNVMRRLLVMRFNRIFQEEEQDPELSDKLREHKDGVFYWALMGYQRLAARGRFLEPKEMIKVRKDFEAAVNPLMSFLQETLEVTGKERDLVPRTELYEAYKAWANDGGVRAVSRTKFYRWTQALPGVTEGRYGEMRTRAFRGLRLRHGLE